MATSSPDLGRSGRAVWCDVFLVACIVRISQRIRYGDASESPVRYPGNSGHGRGSVTSREQMTIPTVFPVVWRTVDRGEATHLFHKDGMPRARTVTCSVGRVKRSSRTHLPLCRESPRRDRHVFALNPAAQPTAFESRPVREISTLRLPIFAK